MLDSITLYVGSYLSEIGDTFGWLVACINSADKAIEVFELHVADVVVIRDAVGFRVRVAVCVRPCVGLRAVSGFDDDLFGEDVLLFKQHLDRTLHLIQRELTLMESRENGDPACAGWTAVPSA